ncbi:hypothetical protein ABMA10_21080 [Plantibacter sp. RU18]
MCRFRTLLSGRVDWNPRQVGRLVRLLWSLTVLGTLVGFLVQALVGARDWSGVSTDMIPVFLGATLGYGLLWLGSVIAVKRREYPPE